MTNYYGGASYCGCGAGNAVCVCGGGAGGVGTSLGGAGGGGGVSWIPINPNIVAVSNAICTTTTTTGGTMSCCKDTKKGNMFYQYELSLYDLSYSATKKPDRLLTMIQGSIEVPDDSTVDFTKVLLVKHAASLVPYSAQAADVCVQVDIKKSLRVNPQN